MADTAVAITAGTGTNIDTRTEATNGNHRQVVVIGDPATNAGVAPVDATAGLKVDLGADNDVTVTGTVDLGATDNAVLDAIAASVAAVDVDATTIIGHVDGIETLLGTIDADTSNLSTKIDTIAGDTTSIQTAVELIDDAVYTDGTGTVTKGVAILGQDGTNPQAIKTDAAGELQVDVLTMPTVAVTNAGITTIAGAISGTEMQVDVLTMPTTTVTATNLDIRDLTNADVVTAELSAVDNAVLDSIAASLAGTLTVTGGGGGTEYTEGATDASITGGAILWEDAADTLRAVSAAKPLPVDLGANNDVTVTGTVDLGATDNAVLDAIAASVAAIDTDTTTIIGHVDGIETLIGTTNTTLTTIDGRVDGIEALLTTIDADTSNLSVVGGGTEATAVRVTIANNSTGVLSIDDNGSTVSIDDGGGVITVDGTVAVTNSDITSIKTAVEILDNAISGSEMQVDVLTMPTVTVDLGANNDVSINAGANAIGKVIPPDYDVTSHTAKAQKYYTSAGAATDGIIWSPAAGKRWHVTLLTVNVSAAATVTIEDDLAGGDSPILKYELAANSGVVLPFGDLYPLTSAEDAADLIITTSAGNVYVTAVGYEV